VTGFHKRKKKRRKEAQKVLQEKDRKKKIQERKRVRNSSLSPAHRKLYFLFSVMHCSSIKILVTENYPGEKMVDYSISLANHFWSVLRVVGFLWLGELFF
jgi:hypothetical protein